MDWHAECRRIHQIGVEERCDPNSNLQIVPFSMHSYINPDLPPGVLVLPGLTDQDRAKLRFLSHEVYRPLKMHAVIISADSHFIELPAVAAHMGIDAGLPDQKRLEEYQRILDERYEGTQANLPEEWRMHAIQTTIKGPHIKPYALFTEYRLRPGGGADIVREKDDWYFINNVLPDWWDVTVN